MTPSFSLAGRTILMAGASSGIGAHLSRVMSAAGATMILGARRVDKVEALADELRGNGGKAMGVALDVTDEAAIIAAYDAAEAEFGTVNTVIANAGLAIGEAATEMDASKVKMIFDTNLTGVFLTVREGAKRMMAAGSAEKEDGRVVLVGSITAEMTAQGDAAYAASKAGVAHLGRQFARDWVRKGINVNTIQPGYIRTELNSAWFATDGGKEQIGKFYRGRLVDIDALNDVVLFLSSDASRQITGSTINIDDGQGL